MVHDQLQGATNKSARHSPVRSSSRKSLRYKPITRGHNTSGTSKDIPSNNLNQALWSTVHTLNLSEQAQLNERISDSKRPGIPNLFHRANGFQYHGAAQHSISSMRTRNEKSILDKVEDMDIDHQSDHEGTSSDSRAAGTSPGSVNEAESRATMESSANTCREDMNITTACEGLKANSKKGKIQPPSKGKKNIPVCETVHGCKTMKKKPIYIILHAAFVRVGGLTGKALSPVRIQAERILIQMEIKTDSGNESLTLHIPCKEVVTIQTNLCEPPYLLVAFVNPEYTQNVLNGAKKNGVLNRVKDVDNLELVIQLTYDSIPKDVKQNLEMLRRDLSNVSWKEISMQQAREILDGKEAKDSTDAPKDKEAKDKENPSLSGRKILKVQENQKKAIHRRQEKEQTSKRDTLEVTPDDSGSSQKVERKKSPVNASDGATETVLSHPKRAYNDTTPREDLSPRARETIDEKPEAKPKGEEVVEKKRHSDTVPDKESGSQNKTAKMTTRKSFKGVSSPENGSTENRLYSRRVPELEAIIAEKEGLLNQRRITLELKELQLEQERNTIRQLRGSLREEQRTRHELETRYEAVNGELLIRNAQDILAQSRVQELESELSQLSLSLDDVRSQNQRLVQEITDIRTRMTVSEEALRDERATAAILQEDLETRRSSLESLRDEIRRKDSEIRREKDLRTEAEERRNEMERTLTTTTEEYEERLRRSDDERTRISRQYEECNDRLTATRDQMRDANSALRRAQETIEEYSRMQPRDWTMSRDEILISEKVLGQGAWGWVKEGTFRGTRVAVKQMHELIVSPHNRRLFEREMQMAARCRHPNLLQFIGATSDNGLALLVTELLDTNLRAVLGQRSLCQDEVLTLTLDVARALNYLHLNKPFPIIHRDISSTNVLLWKREDAWHAKLSDYGAANFMQQCMTANPGASIYAAPEAMTSRQSTKVDVFSFGLLLCEMCIRELPVPGHTNDQIRLITNAHLRDLVQRCTNDVADDRPTMQEVLSALVHLCSKSALGVVVINSRQVAL